MSENNSPEAMVAEWSKGMRLLLSVFLVILLYYSVRLLLMVPPSEKIFADMLGDARKLPEDTQFVLKYWQVILTGIIALNGAGIIAILSLRRPFHVCCVAALVLFLGVIHFHFITTSLISPLGEVITGLSGGV